MINVISVYEITSLNPLPQCSLKSFGEAPLSVAELLHRQPPEPLLSLLLDYATYLSQTTHIGALSTLLYNLGHIRVL